MNKKISKTLSLAFTVTIMEKKTCSKLNSPVCDDFQQIVCTKK